MVHDDNLVTSATNAIDYPRSLPHAWWWYDALRCPDNLVRG